MHYLKENNKIIKKLQQEIKNLLIKKLFKFYLKKNNLLLQELYNHKHLINKIEHHKIFKNYLISIFNLYNYQNHQKKYKVYVYYQICQYFNKEKHHNTDQI